MKKLGIKIILMLCVFIFGITAVYAGGEQESGTAGKKIIFKHNTWHRAVDSHPSIRAVKVFYEELEKRVGDRIEVKIYTGASLGSSTEEVLGGLQNRTIESADWALGSFAEYTKAFLPLDVPYLFINTDIVHDFLDGPMGAAMKKKAIDDAGLRVLAYTDLGFRHFTNNVRPIKAPEDLEGLKIRVQNNKFHIDGIKQFGASPAPMAWAELVTALQQGVMDGQENPIINIADAKIYEVQKYMSLSNHLFTVSSITMSEEFYQSLPKDIQKAIDEAASIAQDYSRKDLAETEKNDMELLKEKLEITYLDDAQLKAFQKIAKNAWPSMAKELDEGYLNKVIKEVEKIEEVNGLR